MQLTISCGGVVMDVDGSHQPIEAMTRDYPGCDESFDVEEVTIGGQDVTRLLSKNAMNDIAAACLDEIRGKATERAILRHESKSDFRAIMADAFQDQLKGAA